MHTSQRGASEYRNYYKAIPELQAQQNAGMVVLAGGVLLFLMAFIPAVINAQQGFISIDCGIPEGSSYTDDETGIFYTSDAEYIHTGENREISSTLLSPSIKQQFRNVRSFPDGDRNCYTLKPVVKGNNYLVRASFMYGNIDGQDMPRFNLFLGVNLWKSINQASASRPGWAEIITIAENDFIPVCLVRRFGNPYISALELRPLNSDMYNVTTASQALVLYNRYDVGSATGQILRYKDDPYDRIWAPFSLNAGRALDTASTVNTEYRFHPPEAAMRTAMAPRNATDALYFNWTSDDAEAQFHLFRHIAELEILGDGQVREFNTCVLGYPLTCYGPFQPSYLAATTIFTNAPFSGSEEYSCSFERTAQSTLPPILNAIEIYTLATLSVVPTYADDLNAIMDLRTVYGVKKNWMGDPCVPINYTWEGLACSMGQAPRIISLNLSSSGLNGTIAPSIANLTSVTSLDLSGNNLSGELPRFLTTLTSLTSLNLSGNQFNGSVPSVLLQRSRNGLLQLSLDGNSNLCKSDSCKSKKNSAVPIAVSITAAVVVLLLASAFSFWWKRTRKEKHKLAATSPAFNSSTAASSAVSFNLDNRRFTYVELASMTNDFARVIGRGGFGVVYHGQMKDGTHVAVKMLSENCRGSAEFQTEAQLLTRVYHRNLVQFIGYSTSSQNLALVLEYMSQGNLARALLGSEANQKVLSWDQRVRIALDIAQGLEYLHVGCKPPIIHRDVKLTNVLLNEKFEAKIADFGISKVFASNEDFTHVSTGVKGTLGYLDPEYCVSNNLNEKSDVYSFGIVLLELITGKPAIIQVSESERIGIVDWMGPLISRGDIMSMVDPRLKGHFDNNSAWTAIDVAIESTRPKPVQRPPMSDVVAQLKEILGSKKADSRSWSLNYEESNTSRSSNSFFNPAAR